MLCPECKQASGPYGNHAKECRLDRVIREAGDRIAKDLDREKSVPSEKAAQASAGAVLAIRKVLEA